MGIMVLSAPDLQLHCPSETCGGVRVFASKDKAPVSALASGSVHHLFLRYTCRNCARSDKTFALLVKPKSLSPVGADALVRKVGEYPPFGPPVPARVITMIGPDRELFLNGRRAENQGLGIGAFAYYRRVVEGQWHRIVAEIGRVAQVLGASPSTVEEIERAGRETQFSKAVETIKHAIPESLRIKGHSPLTLLHDALSDGLHARSDEECLRLASAVRAVLTELADRVGQALRDEKELQQALTTLLNRDRQHED